MANNRMYLVNKITKTKVHLAKNYCGGWFVPNTTNLNEKLNTFFDEIGDKFYEGPCEFELEFEDPNQFKDK